MSDKGKVPEELWKEIIGENKRMTRDISEKIAVNNARENLYQLQMETGLPLICIPVEASSYPGDKSDIAEAYTCIAPGILDGNSPVLVTELDITRKGEIKPLYIGSEAGTAIDIMHVWPKYEH